MYAVSIVACSFCESQKDIALKRTEIRPPFTTDSAPEGRSNFNASSEACCLVASDAPQGSCAVLERRAGLSGEKECQLCQFENPILSSVLSQTVLANHRHGKGDVKGV
jgi:hypothetical protein